MNEDDDNLGIEEDEVEAVVEALDQAKLDPKALEGTSSRPGTFKFGHDPRRGSRRGKGRPNRTTRDIRHGLIESAVKHGYDGQGKDKLEGFFRFLLENDLRSYASLIGRCLPLQAKVNVDVDSNTTLNIDHGSTSTSAIPEGVHLSQEQQEMLRNTPREQMPAPGARIGTGTRAGARAGVRANRRGARGLRARAAAGERHEGFLCGDQTPMTKGSTFFGPRSAHYGLSRDLGVASATQAPDERSPGPRDISENYIQAARTTASAEGEELSP
jgi:hypothetical protein